ncbi:GlsB/YeaQ/YmgE family stress response membrane protein [Sinomonas albida]|uniref:GlsB/YeaQ/YmgE family stress response membrane protein n=1 Tax=Sinomonas albida TaxID=369942 RepID=UPI0010A8E593|nr:GlsB/YeaQ/YmgE family stress response membrane protein [Sinomonas albida]
MGFFGYLILGLIAGAIAKAILPGRQGGGWIATLILGVIGAWLGGLLGGLIFGFDTLGTFFEIRTWITAIVGSIIVLLIWGAIRGRRSRR